MLRGQLKPGERLPATRALARRLGIARNTVVGAYARLAAEGYVSGARSRGTRVSSSLPPAGVEPRRTGGAPPPGVPAALSAYGRRLLAHPDIFPPAVRRSREALRWDFDYNINVSDAASRRAWSRILRRSAARAEAAAARYDFRFEPSSLQRALARYLALTRGVTARPEQIFVLGAYQRSPSLVARLLAGPGEEIVVEDPHMLRLRNAFLAAGARLVPAAGDEAGLRVASLPRPRRRIRLAYTSPSCQWVTGASLPLDRRLQLLRWADRCGAWILENDYNSEYLYQGTPVQSLQGLDTAGRVLYLGSFSRLLSPDPLIGYLVVPRSLVEAVRAARLIEGHHASPLDEEVLTRFLESGEMERLLRRATRRLGELRAVLLEALRAVPGAPFQVRETQGGMHLHARIPGLPPDRLGELVRLASARGVGVYPDLPYYLRPPPVPGLLLGFAGLTPRALREGAAELGKVTARLLRRGGRG